MPSVKKDNSCVPVLNKLIYSEIFKGVFFILEFGKREWGGSINIDNKKKKGVLCNTNKILMYK